MTPVESPIFGTLSLLHVEDGATVSEGDDLCEIEAMKVFTRVYAPVAGTLKYVVDLGEVVGQGDVIAEIE